MRNLASIRVIKEINPIEGADNIEQAIIDGWSCVVKKGDFIVGQSCVYFEIDSFLPIRPEFEFLRKSSYRKMGDQEGFRLKTIRLKGTLSQGLALPLSILDAIIDEEGKTPAVTNGCESWKEWNQKNYHVYFPVGRDVTEFLGVIKYDPPIPAQLAGIAKGNFPSFIRKTDQERIQNLWDKVKEMPDSWEVTEKLDGASCTYYWNEGIFGVCSRNMELIENEDNTLWKIAKRYNIEELLKTYGKNVALQGEVIGEGIQGNPYKIKGQDFYLFDIWDIDKQEYYPQDERCALHLQWERLSGMKRAPIICFPLPISESFNQGINDMLEFADDESCVGDWLAREGVVFKSLNGKFSFKVISNAYLLKNDL
jgi:hypothetical protein